jgi:D-beta-D-heptose 7-phosphate kinase/D-beta-D-heptose 1-phosphate adenosyltransferase
MNKVVLISGGFDPLHSGHMDYIEGAAQLGNVVIALNSDAWLIRKKGFKVLDFDTRFRILNALGCVDWVYAVDDTDGSVCQAIRRIKPDIFANGGDRFADNIPEKKLCEEMGIEMVFNVGGGKKDSSSQIAKRVASEISDLQRQEASKWW